MSRDLADDLAEAYAGKTRAELEEADGYLVAEELASSNGDPFATVMLVKGLPGPAELAGGAAITGRDGEAVNKALGALGFDPESTFRTLARAKRADADERVRTRLRIQVEAVDPSVVVALDKVAAADLSAAFEIERLQPGAPIRRLGRTLLAVDGLEESLGDQARKKRVWSQLQALSPLRSPR